MSLIVQKFGGTSVADERSRSLLAGKAAAARARGDQVVLVVSAMGRRGAPYATDTLLDTLRGVDAEPDGATADLLASCGETISACLVAALLRSRGLPAEPMTAYTAGIRAAGPFQDADPVGADATAIISRLAAGVVPVITGFQAVEPSGRIVTIGRGGSDTSAVVVGAALGADFVDIYTDVPGVAKADPRVLPEAPFMDFLDYESMFRLAKHGSRVLHDKSATLAERGHLKLRVRSTFDEGEGTLIGPAGQAGRQVPDFIGLAAASAGEGSSKVTAIFGRGAGPKLAGTAAEAAARLGAARVESGDPDAAAFSCPAEQAAGLTRALFAALA